VISYLDQYKADHGVEPICDTLTEAGMEIAPSTYYASKTRPPSARSQRDAELSVKIAELHEKNYGVYGVRKMWRRLQLEGESVAQCTVTRLMRRLGLQGAVRGRQRVTTRPAKDEREVAGDLLNREFSRDAPDRTWLADFTYVPTYSGTVYMAFVMDGYSRRIVGWKASTSMHTELVLEALEMALWARGHVGRPVEGKGLIHHSDRGSQYTSIAFTERLIEAGVDVSVGSVGDALDNALAESTIGLYKTELTKGRSWRTFEQVEWESAKWIDWYNQERLHSAIGYRSPAAYEEAYYQGPGEFGGVQIGGPSELGCVTK
jgi:putative transposase